MNKQAKLYQAGPFKVSAYGMRRIRGDDDGTLATTNDGPSSIMTRQHEDDENVSNNVIRNTFFPHDNSEIIKSDMNLRSREVSRQMLSFPADKENDKSAAMNLTSKPEIMHKELVSLQQKIGVLEQKMDKIVSGRMAASDKSASMIRSKSSLGRELQQQTVLQNESISSKVDIMRPPSMTASASCTQLQPNYYSKQVMCSQTDIRSHQHTGSIVPSGEKYVRCESLADKNAEGHEARNVFIRETKHEVLMQLTTSLECERENNARLKQQLEETNSKYSNLEQQFKIIKVGYEQLAQNYERSENLRKKQKLLLRDLQTTKLGSQNINKQKRASECISPKPMTASMITHRKSKPKINSNSNAAIIKPAITIKCKRKSNISTARNNN